MPDQHEFPSSDWAQHQDEGFIAFIGPFWERKTEWGPVLAFRAEAKHRNRRGVVQGGVLMTFADRALGMFARHATGGHAQATAQLDVHFVSSVQIGEVVTLEPQLIRKTRSLMFLRGTVVVGDRIVAMASGVWKLLRSPEDESA
ncbi:MAG TPA: PaaI family thioesterase [Bosea sp. (in: a-proteobacteria)]|jgi:acyl-coenzyme A thioesterase PaaI-like protein|uniref:PaaI family thioesterase n=1 Tax=Bosea sp. (in: a-proteobacteria) TaxID=1871050 RepID=UPI002E15B77D|nr:PaaI family thioesterase [Bosea sp. (in: a-proteobacteria)]